MIVVALLAFAILAGFVHVWVTLLDDVDKKDDFCYDCPHGFCLAEPETEKCLKWRVTNEDKDNEPADN